MAHFTFSLDGVLAHRKRLEQAAQRLVAERQAAAIKLRSDLVQLNDELAAANGRLRDGHLVGSIDLAYLTTHRLFADDAGRRAAAVAQRLALADQAVEETRLRLVEAARAHRALAKLRERHLERWRADRARAELAEADDATSKQTAARFAKEAQDEADAAPAEVPCRLRP